MNVIETGRQYVNAIQDHLKNHQKHNDAKRLQDCLDATAFAYGIQQDVAVVVETWEVLPNSVGLRFVGRTEKGLDYLEAWGLVRRHMTATETDLSGPMDQLP